MSLIFQGSEAPTLGVEIELQILNADSLDLSPHSPLILSACKKQGLERVNSEIHQSMIEVNSEISKNVKECGEDLQRRIFRLQQIVESEGLKLALTGTHPFQNWSERLISHELRYQHLHDKFQWLIRRMNIYGMHVHIGVPTGDRALSICKEITRYLPHLLALSANSPYWHGIDTGMQSSRVNILDAFPFSGLPLFTNNWKDFEEYYTTMHLVGAINSFKDLYWYVRPHLRYGTVEVRICDGLSTLKETLALVAFIQCLVHLINQQLDDPSFSTWTQKHHWIASENLWTAARDGLEGFVINDLKGKKQKISNAIFELIETLIPIAKDLNCLEELQDIGTILHQGNGASRQRKIYDDTQSLREVVRETQQVFEMSLVGLKI
jgi:carboxylate-amine ligase